MSPINTVQLIKLSPKKIIIRLLGNMMTKEEIEFVNKISGLEFLVFGLANFDTFGTLDHIDMDRIPEDLFDILTEWSKASSRKRYFSYHDGSQRISRDGWQVFIGWINEEIKLRSTLESFSASELLYKKYFSGRGDN